MKQITIKIDDEQYKELNKISESYRIKNVSWLIRRAIDYYVTSHRKEDIPWVWLTHQSQQTKKFSKEQQQAPRKWIFHLRPWEVEQDYNTEGVQ